MYLQGKTYVRKRREEKFSTSLRFLIIENVGFDQNPKKNTMQVVYVYALFYCMMIFKQLHILHILIYYATQRKR